MLRRTDAMDTLPAGTAAAIDDPHVATGSLSADGGGARCALDSSGLMQFDRLYSDYPDPVMMVRGDRFVGANRAALEAFGVLTADALLQRGPLDVSPEFQSDGSRSDVKVRTVQGLAWRHGCHRVDWTHRRIDSLAPVEHEMTLVPVDIDGEHGFHVLLSDRSERRRTDTALQRADLLLRAVYAATEEAVILVEASRIVVANEAALRLFGCATQQQLRELPLRNLAPEVQPDGTPSGAWFERHLALAERGRNAASEWQLQRLDSGVTFPAELRISPLQIDGRAVAQVMIRNVSRLKAAESEIRQLAYFDGLTQLANRRQLIERLGRALASSSRTGLHSALLIIDLDKFKAVNERLGREQGDVLLQTVARRLTACTRANDTVARLGDDEFVVVFRDLSGEPLEAAVEAEAGSAKVLAHLRMPFVLGDMPWDMTASIGVTLFGSDGTPEAMLRRADLAMSAAKGSGGNRMRFFDPTIQQAVTERGALEADLRFAIERQQFSLHFQPQIDAALGVVGAEALLRWRHPARGMVSPAEFIPLAEETGLILPLGRWVLQAACRQLAAWRGTPHADGLTIAVNISALQIRQADFVDEVLGAVGAAGADPALLKLELTESLMLHDIEDIIAKMTTLKAVGMQFSLDDFGTGYSSLAYLKRLPLDQLKIDQTFVRDVLVDANDAAIVRTIVALARSMGLHVIAEGVETTEQQAWLSNNGCHAYQGYLFSRPLPAEDFVALLHTFGPAQSFGDTGLIGLAGFG